MTRRARVGLVVALAGCGAGGADPDAHGGDALPGCPAADLELGGCATSTGAPCSGAIDEERRFVELPGGAELASVIGPQNAEMFVLSARTAGIEGGDPDDPASPDNPELGISIVTGAGAQIGRFRARTGFVAEDPLQVAAGLFVVIDGDDHAGELLRAHGVLLDRLGARRCGEVSFTAL